MWSACFYMYYITSILFTFSVQLSNTHVHECKPCPAWSTVHDLLNTVTRGGGVVRKVCHSGGSSIHTALSNHTFSIVWAMTNIKDAMVVSSVFTHDEFLKTLKIHFLSRLFMMTWLILRWACGVRRAATHSYQSKELLHPWIDLFKGILVIAGGGCILGCKQDFRNTLVRIPSA